MTSENIEAFYAAKIYLKEIANPHGLLDLWVCSRESYDDDDIFIPILKNISGLGQTVGQELPLTSTGAVVIEDSWGSLSFERKFSDLLNRFTATEQSIEIYYSRSELNSYDFQSGLTLMFRGKIKDWITNSQNEPATITLNVEGTNIADRYLTKAVEGDTFFDAPDSSIGKNIPIVIGYNVEIDPIKVSNDKTSTVTPEYVEYVWASTLGITHVNGGVQSVLIRNDDNVYQAITNAADFDVAPFESAGTAAVSYDYYDREATHTGKQDDVAYPLDYTDGSDNYIIVGGTFWVAGNYGGSWDTESQMIVELYERRPKGNKPPRRQPIATCEIEKSEYLSDFRNTAYFEVEFRFEKPIFLNSPNGYCINFSQTLQDDEADYVELGCVNSATPYFRRGHYTGATPAQKRPNKWQYRASGAPANKRPVWKIYAMRWSASVGPLSSDINTDGIAHQTVGFLQHTFSSSDQPVCDLSILDPIFVVNGLLDDSSGTITGTPNAVMEKPFHVLQAITREFDGYDWLDNTNDYDFDEFATQAARAVDSSSPFFIKLAGRTDNATTLSQLIQSILKNAMGKLVTRNNGKMAFYFWGSRSEETFQFTDDNALFTSMKELNSASIVNRVQMYYDKKLSTVTARKLASETSFKSFNGALVWDPTNNAYAQVAGGDSLAIYGSRTLNSKATAFDLVSWDTAPALARYYMTMFNLPHRIITLRATFVEAAQIELLDVGTVQSVKLPCYFGTDPETQFPTLEGVEVDPKRGGEWKRAQRYRVQVVQKDNDLSEKEAPAVLLTCKIIRTEYGDMT